jgi:hypothetical protein
MFARWWQKKDNTTETPIDPQMIRPPESGIDDGVDYRQPVVIPWHVSREPQAVLAHLEGTQSYSDQTLSTYRFQFDGRRSQRYDGRVWMPIDDPLEEWDWDTRKEVLTNCHAAYHRNPIAKQAVDLTRRFVVGKGHTVSAKNRDVQDVIDRFRANKENYIHGYDRSFIQDVQVDGELFVRIFSDGGEVVIAPIPPWYVRGAETEPGFMRRVRYWILEYVQNGELIQERVPSDDVIHIAINNHSYELRGRPDLFVILPWLRAYNEWLVDRARQNKWRSALLWVVKVAQTAPGILAKVRAAWRKPPTPGSVAVVPDSVDVDAVTNSINANDASEDGRQIKMMSAVGVGIPEYMLSDGENANLASATAQQLPALWKFTDGQQLMAEQVWTPIYRRVIQAAVDAGELPEIVPVEDVDGDVVPDSEPMAAVDAFAVGYYELQSDDPKTLAEALGTLIDRRVMSIETARERAGLDHHEEEKRIEREEVARRDAYEQGRDFNIPNTNQQDEQDTDGE